MNIVRSIENATEGSFVRCGQQSINLFKYIIQHFNEPNFEQNIKQTIKDEHENSFHTLSNRAYEKSYKKIFPYIDIEFEKYEKNMLIEISINEIKKEYIQKGYNEIKKELNVVKDHPKVSYFIEQFIFQIRTTIDEKYVQYIKVKNKLFEDSISQINLFAQQELKNVIDNIRKELFDNNDYKFNEKQIHNCKNKNIELFKENLYKFKKDNSLVLLSDQIINGIITDKKSYIDQTINEYINRQIDNAKKNQEEREIKSLFLEIQKQIIRQEYHSRVDQLLSDLRSNLTDREYYQSNFRQLSFMNDNIQETILNYIISKNDEIVAVTCQKLNQDDQKNSIIINRLNKKNQLLLDENAIHLIIYENQDELSQRIEYIFGEARQNLAEIQINIKRTRINFQQARIESQHITTYPDGIIVTSDWELIRIENRQFSEKLDDIGQAITKSFIILLNSFNKIGSIIIKILNLSNHKKNIS